MHLVSQSDASTSCSKACEKKGATDLILPSPFSFVVIENKSVDILRLIKKSLARHHDERDHKKPKQLKT